MLALISKCAAELRRQSKRSRPKLACHKAIAQVTYDDVFYNPTGDRRPRKIERDVAFASRLRVGVEPA